jgi:uncharacterized protein
MYFNQPIYRGYQDYPLTNPLNRNHNDRYTMTIEGNGSITVKPDQAKLILGVATENQNVQQAQQENTRLSNEIINALKQIGIEEKDIRTTTYSVYPRYDYVEGKSTLRGYEVEHLFEVTVNDLSKVGLIYDAAIKNGANRSGTIQFRVSNPDVYYREALTLAIRQAREKAETIAHTIGTTIMPIPIKIIEQGTGQERPIPTPYQVAGVSTEQTPPIQEGRYTIHANVKVVYDYGGLNSFTH